MSRRRKSEETKQGAPEWMVTYGDMVTLLLCFFVLLFAFSEIDAKKFEAIMRSFQGSLGILESGRTIEPNKLISEGLREELTTKQTQELEDFRKLKEKLQQFLEENNLQADVLITMETQGLVLRFQDNVLFDSGKSELKTTSVQLLAYIAKVLNEKEFVDKYIRVEGHTDSDPLRLNARYETNWELSVSRASNVVRFLIEDMHISPVRLSASGYAEYHPVASNETPEGKAKNRRVDIVILRSEYVVAAP